MELLTSNAACARTFIGKFAITHFIPSRAIMTQPSMREILLNGKCQQRSARALSPAFATAVAPQQGRDDWRTDLSARRLVWSRARERAPHAPTFLPFSA